MTSVDIQEIEKAAKEEIRQEKFRAAVEAKKRELLSAKWYHKLFPFVITIRRRKYD